MNSSANIKKKLFYLPRQKDKDLAGSVYGVHQGPGNQGGHQPWSQIWAIRDAGSRVQFPCCHTCPFGKAQHCVMDKRHLRIWPSSWMCEEDRGLTKHMQGLLSFSGAQVPPVARSRSWRKHAWTVAFSPCCWDGSYWLRQIFLYLNSNFKSEDTTMKICLAHSSEVLPLLHKQPRKAEDPHLRSSVTGFSFQH